MPEGRREGGPEAEAHPPLSLKRRLLLLLLFAACFVLVLVSVYQGEQLRFGRDHALSEKAAAAAPAGTGEKIHLWMVMVDSWPLRLLGQGRMPFVDSLLEKGVYGSAVACADALSVPCLKAIYTGRDLYSVFFLFKDVMTADQKAGGSVLEELHRRGYTIGIAANHSWNQFRHAYDHAVLHDLGNIPSDNVVVGEAMDIFEKYNPDIMMTAIIDLDHAAHKYKPGTGEYYEAALESDRLVKEIYEKLPENWHILIFGDHGHDESGRHVPGLDIPAAYVYHGPAFSEGVRRDIDVKTHYFILSGLFKVPPAGRPINENLHELFKPGWLEPDFFPPSTAHAAASGLSRTLANLRDSLAYEVLFLLLLFAAGLFVIKAALPSVKTAAAAAASGALCLVLFLQGLAYLWLRETLYQQWWGWDYVVVAVEFIACLALARALWKGSRHAALIAASILFYILTLFLHLSTIYNFGATRYLMHGLIIAMAAATAVHVRTRRAHEDPGTRGVLLMLLAALALAVLNIDMLVVNFKFRYLYWSHALFGAVPPALVYGLVSGLLCAVLFNRRREGIAAYVLLSAVVMAAPLIPPHGFAAVLGLALLLQVKDAVAPTAPPRLRTPWKIVLALVYLFYFLEFSFARMTEMAVVILAGALAIRALAALRGRPQMSESFRNLVPLLGALIVVGLGLYTFWISFSMRIGGIQLVPILKWLPMEKMTSSWPFIMFVMIYVFVTPLMMLLALFRQAFGNDDAAAKAWFFVGLGKIIAVAVFLRALVLNEPGQFVLRDSFEELIVWIVLALTGAFALLLGRSRPARKAQDRPA